MYSGMVSSGMVGAGRSSIAEVCDISRANCADGSMSEALQALGSLGTGGKHESNQERDFHTWIKGIYDTNLEPFKVPILLNASWFVQSFILFVISGLM